MCIKGKRSITIWEIDILQRLAIPMWENQEKKETFGVNSLLYFKLIWIDKMQVFTKTRNRHWQIIIYIADAEIKTNWPIVYIYYREALE